jgi:hypothetical protein
MTSLTGEDRCKHFHTTPCSPYTSQKVIFVLDASISLKIVTIWFCPDFTFRISVFVGVKFRITRVWNQIIFLSQNCSLPTRQGLEGGLT